MRPTGAAHFSDGLTAWRSSPRLAQVERKSEYHTSAQLIHRLAIYQRMWRKPTSKASTCQMAPTSAEIRLFQAEETIGVHLENRISRTNLANYFSTSSLRARTN